MEIINVIEKINDAYETVYETYRVSYLNERATITFTSGYCYEFFLLINRFFPLAKLVVKNDKMHCAALIDDEIYDSTGLIDNPCDFHLATGCDMEYIYKYYASFSVGFKDTLTKEVVKSVLSKDNVYSKKFKKQVQV